MTHHTEHPELPPCLIHVDKEGRMWHLGAEMVHQGINQLLREHVRLDEHGWYIIDFHGQRCYVEVEDTFFVITRLEERPAGPDDPPDLFIRLNDNTEEELDPATLSQAEDHVLYARIKDGRFPARFLRPAYYQLAGHIEERGGRFVLPYKGRDFPIQ